MRAIASDKEGTGRVADILLAGGADPHARDAVGRGVIDHAATEATKRKLDLLLAAGGSWTRSAIREFQDGPVQSLDRWLPFEILSRSEKEANRSQAATS